MQSEVQITDAAHALLATLLVRTVPLCDASLQRALNRMDALFNLKEQLDVTNDALQYVVAKRVDVRARFLRDGRGDGVAAEMTDAAFDAVLVLHPDLLHRLAGKVRLAQEKTAWTLLTRDAGLEGGIDHPGLNSDLTHEPDTRMSDSSTHSTASDLPSLANLHSHLLNLRRRSLALLRRISTLSDGDSPPSQPFRSPTHIDPLEALQWTAHIAGEEACRLAEKVEIAKCVVRGCFGLSEPSVVESVLSESPQSGAPGASTTYRPSSPSASSSSSTVPSLAPPPPFAYHPQRDLFLSARNPDVAALLEYSRDRWRAMERGRAAEKAGGG
ncbi:hypothetical protein HDU93_000323 [Gonapodya sp. JEL0774]|nr:hypothetical protein HDU93_000323 [Gonapodya sp. JEL0774]